MQANSFPSFDAPLITLTPVDVHVDMGSTFDSDARVSAVSKNGRAVFAEIWGAAAVGVSIPKDKLEGLLEHLERRGLGVSRTFIARREG